LFSGGKSEHYISLSQELIVGEAGARVVIADLPQVEGVNGPDDLIKTAGEVAFMAVLDGAHLFEKNAVSEAETMINGAANAEDTARCITAIAHVKDGRIRDALLDKLIAKPGNRADLRKRVAREIAALDESQKSFKETIRQESLLRMKLDPGELLLEIATFFEKFLYALISALPVIQEQSRGSSHVRNADYTTKWVVPESPNHPRVSDGKRVSRS